MDETKKNTAPIDGEEDAPLTEDRQRMLDQAIAEYRRELEELEESRRQRAIRRAGMTEEEILADMVADLEAVLADAEANGMSIIRVGDDEDEDGNEDGDGNEDEDGTEEDGE